VFPSNLQKLNKRKLLGWLSSKTLNDLRKHNEKHKNLNKIIEIHALSFKVGKNGSFREIQY